MRSAPPAAARGVVQHTGTCDVHGRGGGRIGHVSEPTAAPVPPAEQTAAPTVPEPGRPRGRVSARVGGIAESATLAVVAKA
jgi:hypothetical protein